MARKGKNCPFVFVSERGSPFTTAGYRKMIARLGEAARFSFPVHPHMFRHASIAPGLKRAAIMFNPDNAAVSVFMPSIETAARSLKVTPIRAPVHGDAEIETAITALGREPGGGLVVIGSASTFTHRTLIISAAARNNVPAVYSQSESARDGGLLSYGVDQVDAMRRAATYVDRIRAARSRAISR